MNLFEHKAWSKSLDAIIVALLIVLGFCGVWACDLKAFPPQTVDVPPQRILVSDKFHGNWMSINRINTVTNENGFDASMTYVMCKFKPVVKKVKDGLYEITFTSEIAENIP